MNTATILTLIIAVVGIGVAVWMYMGRQKTRKLRTKYGNEYDHVVTEQRGDARKAEAVLDKRETRVNKLGIRPLDKGQQEHFAAEWKTVQESFVDDPRLATARADRLVNEAMRARGYPMGDFEQRAADISVEHPQVVDNYRAAHEIAVRDERGEATTEQLRRAMQHYRNLFEDLLQTALVEHPHLTRT
jgi:hypothetical protein